MCGCKDANHHCHAACHARWGTEQESSGIKNRDSKCHKIVCAFPPPPLQEDMRASREENPQLNRGNIEVWVAVQPACQLPVCPPSSGGRSVQPLPWAIQVKIIMEGCAGAERFVSCAESVQNSTGLSWFQWGKEE